MKTRKTLTIIFGFVLAFGVLAPDTWASRQDQATQLTFNQSTQIPGNVVLQPGTYWFTISETASNRNVVRVFDLNWQPITATVATPTEQAQPSDNTRLLFAERSADQPNVLLKWFYPGNTVGHEFVYSGPEGRAISEETVDVVTVFADPTPTIPAISASGAQY